MRARYAAGSLLSAHDFLCGAIGVCVAVYSRSIDEIPDGVPPRWIINMMTGDDLIDGVKQRELDSRIVHTARQIKDRY